MSGRSTNDRRFDDHREFRLGASVQPDPNAGETQVKKSAANAVNDFAYESNLSTGDGRSLNETLELRCRFAAGDQAAKREAVDSVDTSKPVIKDRHKGRRSTYPPGTFDGV